MRKYLYISILCVSIVGNMILLYKIWIITNTWDEQQRIYQTSKNVESIQSINSDTTLPSIPRTNIIDINDSLWPNGEKASNDVIKKETFLQEATCILSGTIFSTSLLQDGDLANWWESDMFHTVKIDIQNNEKKYQMYGNIRKKGSICEKEGGTCYVYSLPDKWLKVAEGVYNIPVNNQYFILEIPPHDEQYDIDFLSQFSLPECEPNTE